MCLAILKLPEGHITKRQLRTAWSTNSDGAGFMYNQNEELIIDKGYFTFRKFYKALRDAENNNPKSTFTIHLRFATSGKKDEQNCHPFEVHKGLGFVHNGIFTDYSGGINLSDTAIFNLSILQSFPEDFIFNEGIIKLLERYCEFMSKLVFLNNKGEYLIVGEDDGEWIDKIWFSNGGYKPDFGFSGKSYGNWVETCKCDTCLEYFNWDEVDWEKETHLFICKWCKEKRVDEFFDNFCPYCSQALPEKSEFCPFCHNFLEEE